MLRSGLPSKDILYGVIVPRLPEWVRPMVRSTGWLRSAIYLPLKHLRLKHVDQSINLASIPKSGTNYSLQLLINYLFVYYENRAEPVLNHDIQRWFTNNRPPILRGQRKYSPSHPIIWKSGYRDLYYGHDIVFVPYIKGKVITLYRNPFDFCLSWYHFRYKKRGADVSVQGCVEEWLPRWIKRYQIIQAMKSRPNVLPVQYEEIFLWPRDSFAGILQWLKIPVDDSALERALEFSSIETLKASEMSQGPLQRTPTFQGSFVRSGRVGDWKRELDADVVAQITEQLGKSGIAPDDFILEEPTSSIQAGLDRSQSAWLSRAAGKPEA